MAASRVLVVAGTHGNEINGPWLLEQWETHPDLLDRRGLQVETVLGNPEACRLARRYVDRDLNRSFRPEWLGLVPESFSSAPQDVPLEVLRARELMAAYGSSGSLPCSLVFDLHSTTAAMGASLVVYGRRPADLTLAAALQERLGLPVYLHEGDQAQQGFLVERWPCGLVVEIGPVPQGVRSARVVEQTRLVLQAAFDVTHEAAHGLLITPSDLVVHRHLGSIDVPRDPAGRPDACIHPQLQGRDWHPLRLGDPLFLRADGEVIRHGGPEGLVPVFINEAAYAEKAIAFSFTSRERWPLDPSGPGALRALLMSDQRGEPL